MEEAERRKESNAEKFSQILRVCQNQSSVQMAGQREKVSPSSSDASNNLVIILALASPSVSGFPTRIRGSRTSKLAQNHTALYPNCDVSHVVSPYFSKNHSCSLNGNSRMIEDVNVGNANCNVTHVVSPYFSKDHSALTCNNSDVNSREIEDLDVGNDNCDVALGVSPYFSKKDDGFMVEEDENGCDDDRKSNVVLKGKRGKRGRENGGGSLENGSGDGNGELRGADGRGNVENCCGMAVAKHDKTCKDVVEKKRKKKVTDDRREDVVPRGKRSKRRREDVGNGEVLGVETNTVKRRGKEVNYSEIEEKEVGESNLASVTSVVKREEKSEDLRIEKGGDFLKKDVPSEAKRSKKRRQNALSVEILGVESSDVMRKGKDGTCYGFEKGAMHVKDVNLSKGMPVVKQEERLEDVLEVKDADSMREKAVSKCKKNKRRRDKVGTGEILDSRSHEVEKGVKIGTFDRSEKVKHHVEVGNLLGEVPLVKHEETHGDTVKVNEVDNMRKKVVLKGKRSKQRRENVGTGKVVDSQLCKVEEGNCHVAVRGEELVGERNAPAGLPVVKEKRENLGKKERDMKIRCTDMTSSDGMRVVSPYFVKMDDDDGGTMSDGKEQVKKKRKKKTMEIDRACNLLEREASHVVSSIVVSPFLRAEGANDHENSGSESMKKGTEQKVKKQRKSKEIKTCLGDKEMETKKKLKEERKMKKRRQHIECYTEEKDQKKSSGVGSQGLFLSGLSIEKEEEAEPKEGLRKITTTATSDLQEVSCQRDHTAETNLKHGTVVSDLEKNYESCTEPRDATPCSKNVRRKRVKSLKNDKNKDDQVSSADGEACNKTLRSTIKESKKMKKKALLTSKRLLEAGQEDVIESSTIDNRKEDCINDHQSSLPPSPTLNVSPYFQKLSVNEKREDERDKSYHKSRSKNRADKADLKEFDQLLSKYEYKSSTVNVAGNNVGKDEANDEVTGSKPKRKKRANTTLTRAEKFCEAYQRKDPKNTWKPPSSPYNLLQEDHADDPWRVLVICMLLNITTGPQVRQVLSLFFQRCPNAEAALNRNELEIAVVIQSLGLHRKRAAMIRRFSREYLSDEWTHVTQLHGIGKYAADAYAIFCNGMWDQVTPNDHMLNYYWKFLQKRALRAR